MEKVENIGNVGKYEKLQGNRKFQRTENFEENLGKTQFNFQVKPKFDLFQLHTFSFKNSPFGNVDQ